MLRDFINIDCMDGMNKYPDNYFGLAIVDPPYGIDICSNNNGAGGGVAPHKNRNPKQPKKKRNSEEPSPLVQVGGGLCIESTLYKAFDDTQIPSAEYFKELMRVSKKQIIWGATTF